MMRARHAVLFLILAGCSVPSGTLYAQNPSPRPGELFPRVKPAWSSPREAPVDDVKQPLASAEDHRAFDATWKTLIEEAEKGAPEDRAALADLMQRRSNGAGVGMRRLLVLKSLQLSASSGLTKEQLVERFKSAASLLMDNTIACTQERVRLKSQANVIGHTVYSRSDIADDLLLLAGLRYRAGDAEGALATLAEAEATAKNDAAYLASRKDSIARFRSEVTESADIAKRLQTNPDDKEANRLKGLAVLAQGGDVRSAAKFLAKSDDEQLQKLGSIILGPVTLETRLALAQAAGASLSNTKDEAQVALALLMQEQIEAIKADRQASEEQKARADLLIVKTERVLNKAVERAKLPKVVNFFGQEGTTDRVVYILDHSGSMLDYFDFLKGEAFRSIGNLTEEHQFNVIMVAESARIMGPAKSLLRATADNRQKVMQAIADTRAQGKNDDELAMYKEAFAAAFAMKPTAIFFLTDGRAAPELADVVTAMNRDKTVKVMTYAFIQISPDAEEMLKKIAKNSGGTYKFVRENELGRDGATKRPTLISPKPKDPVLNDGRPKPLGDTSDITRAALQELSRDGKWDEAAAAAALSKRFGGASREWSLTTSTVNHAKGADGPTIRFAFEPIAAQELGGVPVKITILPAPGASFLLTGEAAKKHEGMKSGEGLLVKATAARVMCDVKATTDRIRGTKRSVELTILLKDLTLSD